jgi:hypothetical protein
MSGRKETELKHFQRILQAALALTLLAASPLFAAGITMSLTSAIAAPGSTGNSFEVDLTNLGPTPVTVGGFSFELLITTSDISLTDVSTLTATPYIFLGNSTFGPDLSGPSSGQAIDASDVFSVPMAGTTLDSGDSFGLGHVLFDVSSGAVPGIFAVDLAKFPQSTLSDAAGNNLDVDQLSPGQITISGATVPEPRSLWLLSIGAIAILALRLMRLGPRNGIRPPGR